MPHPGSAGRRRFRLLRHRDGDQNGRDGRLGQTGLPGRLVEPARLLHRDRRRPRVLSTPRQYESDGDPDYSSSPSPPRNQSCSLHENISHASIRHRVNTPTPSDLGPFNRAFAKLEYTNRPGLSTL